MTKTQAINLYLKHTIHAPFTIRRLMLWDSRLDLTQLASKFNDGATNQAAFSLAKKFKLKYMDGREN